MSQEDKTKTIMMLEKMALKKFYFMMYSKTDEQGNLNIS